MGRTGRAHASPPIQRAAAARQAESHDGDDSSPGQFLNVQESPTYVGGLFCRKKTTEARALPRHKADFTAAWDFPCSAATSAIDFPCT